MTTVVDAYNQAAGPVVICDFSPPRSADPAFVDRVADVPADFISVAYNPGRLPRADSITVASVIRQRLGKQTLFALSPRDMNKIALQSQLLGAAMLGLENVLVLGGDNLTEREMRHGVKQVRDIAPTALIRDVAALKEGVDYRGANLQGPADLCVGGAADLEKDFEREAKLAAAKVEAGVQFLMTQPIYSLEERERFLDLYESIAGGPLPVPVFWGLQVLTADGLVFGNVPDGVRSDLEKGRPGAEIAAEMLGEFIAGGVRGVYLVPPILKTGARDYAAAAQTLHAIRW